MTDPQTPTQSQQTMLPSMMCVDALVAAAGNVRMAAEQLGVKPETLIASIAQDPAAEATLNAQLRTLTSLHTFDTFRMAKMLIDNAMTDMEPKDLARFFSDLARQISEITDNKTTTHNVNIAEYVMRSLSPEARDALMALAPALASGGSGLGVGGSSPGSGSSGLRAVPDEDTEAA